MKKTIFFGLVLTLIIPGYAGALEKVKFAQAGPGLGNLPAYVAEDEGYFERNGIKPELIVFRGGSGARNAFIGGSAEFLISTYDHVFITSNKGYPTRIIVGFRNDYGMKLSVKKDAPYKSLKDLIGKSVGITRYGSSTDNFMRYVFKENGIEPGEDVKLLPVGIGATVWAALDKDHIQAGMIHDPFLTTFIVQGKIRILDDLERYKTAGYGVSCTVKLIQEKPELVRRVAKSLAEALRDMKADKSLIMRVAKGRYPDLDPKVMKIMLETYGPSFAFEGVPNKDSLKGNNDLLKIGGAIKKDFAYEDLVDLRFIK